MKKEGEGMGMGDFMLFHLVNTIMQILFGMLATMILMWFSRYREYRADAGSRFSYQVKQRLSIL